MDFPGSADVVIVGGGVMGASTAYHLAQKGCRNVVLLERAPLFGQEATGKCAGGIRYQFSTEINVRLSLLSLPMLDRFEEELGQAIGLRHCGYLFFMTTEKDVQALRAIVTMQHRLGVMTEWLSGDDVRARLPFARLNDVLAGTWNAADGLADPNSVVQGYISGARHIGATCLSGVEVTGVRVKHGMVHGVQTSQGEISTDVVVNAAGPWAREVGSMAGLDIPVVPLRRQIAVTTAIPNLPPDFPFLIDFGRSLYFHKEGPGLLTGMSNPNEKPGFDQRVDQDWELVHFEAALERLPFLEDAGIASRWAGLYEVTPDAHPILGPVPELQGFYNVAGFSGHGFMHGPACGLLLAEEILDGGAHTLDVSPLRLDRFRSGKLIAEYNVI